jgi:hypothetical protein
MDKDTAATPIVVRPFDKPEPSPELMSEKPSAVARALKRPLSPGVKFDPNEQDGHVLTAPHSDLLLWALQVKDAFGTRSSSIATTFLDQLMRLVPDAWDEDAGCSRPNEIELNAALAMVVDLGPRNIAQAALAAQMVAVHWMQMRLSAQALNRGNLILANDAALAGKMARTFALQLEALNKLQGKQKTARQSIRVRKELHQHVHYHDTRGTVQNDGQPPARGNSAPDRRSALPSSDARGERLPITSRTRKARM